MNDTINNIWQPYIIWNNLITFCKHSIYTNNLLIGLIYFNSCEEAQKYCDKLND